MQLPAYREIRERISVKGAAFAGWQSIGLKVAEKLVYQGFPLLACPGKEVALYADVANKDRAACGWIEPAAYGLGGRAAKGSRRGAGFFHTQVKEE